MSDTSYDGYIAGLGVNEDGEVKQVRAKTPIDKDEILELRLKALDTQIQKMKLDSITARLDLALKSLDIIDRITNG